MSRLLLVEDDPVARRAFARLLRRWCLVETATTWAEAIALMRAHRYSKAVIDVGLPDGDGLHLVARLRRAQPWCESLIVTGLASPSIPNRAYLLGAGFIRKPDVARELSAFAQRPSQQRAVQAASARVEAYARRHRLSARQTELIQHRVAGVAREELASALGVAESSLKTMVRAILRKTGHRRLEQVCVSLLAPVVRSEGSS